MKKLVIFILISMLSLFAQKDDKGGQNVELPDFVITGTEKVSVEKVQKIAPGFISTISEEFIKPIHSPEELELRSTSDPLKKDINFMDSVQYHNGYLDVAAGIYNLPSAELFYSSPFTSGLFSGNISGLNQRAYIPHSDKYKFTGGANLLLYTDANSSFLPGSEYRFYVNGGMESYKLFASPVPDRRRTLNSFEGNFRYNNFLSDYFNMALSIDNEYTALSEEKFVNNVLSFSGFSRFALENFVVNIEAKYRNVALEDSTITGNKTDYFSLLPKVGLRISELFRAEFGFNFTKAQGSTFTSPYASLGMKIDRNLTLFGAYSPYAELNPPSLYLKQNNYLDPDSITTRYVKFATDMIFIIKYEYQKYFQINAGVNIKSSDDYPYFSESSKQGEFVLRTTRLKYFDANIELMYHLGPYGYLYGKGDLIFAKDSINFFIPFTPSQKAEYAYGYNFAKLKLETEIKLKYRSEVYTDIKNKNKLPAFLDLGFRLMYHYKPKFLFTLELANLLQYDNYIWTGYKEIPLNVSAGIKLIF